jgi:pimeloyl-ACP methyl ester carboxylesterase
LGGASDYAEINGALLRYEIAGDGAPVVLLHAGVADSRMWEDQVGLFSERHRVLRYDMRGFGSSSFPAGSFSFAADLLALMDYAGIDRAALVGASMGANVALTTSTRTRRRRWSSSARRTYATSSTPPRRSRRASRGRACLRSRGPPTFRTWSDRRS